MFYFIGRNFRRTYPKYINQIMFHNVLLPLSIRNNTITRDTYTNKIKQFHTYSILLTAKNKKDPRRDQKGIN